LGLKTITNKRPYVGCAYHLTQH